MVHIWGVHLPGVQDRLARLQALLCDAEREKAARFFREADRQSSIAARGALRFLLSGYTGIPAVEIAFDYSDNGKPHVIGSDVEFNVSHSADWVVLAFGRNLQVGVDVEKIKRELDLFSIASRYYTPEEVALMTSADDPHMVFFQLWARKEAYVKAQGSGVFRDLKNLRVPLDGNRLPDVAEKDGWHFHRLEAGSKYAAAVVTDRKLSSVPCYDFGGLKWDD